MLWCLRHNILFTTISGCSFIQESLKVANVCTISQKIYCPTSMRIYFQKRLKKQSLSMTVDPRWEENQYGIIKDEILRARMTEIILVLLCVCILGITTRVLQTWARAGCPMIASWWAHITYMIRTMSSPIYFDILQHIKIITILWVVFLLASFAIFIGKRK